MGRTPELDEEVRALAVAHLRRYGKARFNLLEAEAARRAGYGQGDLWEVIRSIVAGWDSSAEMDAPLPDGIVEEPAPKPPKVEKPPALLRQPARSRRVATHSDRLENLESDIQMMRQFSIKTDEDGRESIKFPILFAAMIDKQVKALELHHKIGEKLFDADRVRDYLAGVSEIVIRHVEALPDVHEAILADFDALNERFASVGQNGDS